MKIYWGRFSSWQIRLTFDLLTASTFFLIRQIWKPNWAIGSMKKVMENISSQTKATWISRPMLGLYQKLWRHLVFIKMGKFYIKFPTGFGKFAYLKWLILNTVKFRENFCIGISPEWHLAEPTLAELQIMINDGILQNDKFYYINIQKDLVSPFLSFRLRNDCLT